MDMKNHSPKFTVGQLVAHKLFGYRGVIIDIDPSTLLVESWPEITRYARTPAEESWYRVLVHGSAHETYVSERNLREDFSGTPIEHPMINDCFDGFENGHYVRNANLN